MNENNLDGLRPTRHSEVAEHRPDDDIPALALVVQPEPPSPSRMRQRPPEDQRHGGAGPQRWLAWRLRRGCSHVAGAVLNVS